MELKFESEKSLLPAIVQDRQTLEILMLGYMNQEAFEKTAREKIVTFFSRSKNRLWTKGETSGNFLKVAEIKADCDADAILILADPSGPACHTGSRSCFNTPYNQNFIFQLERIIEERYKNPASGSYTASLHEKGIGRIAQKLGEEAVETIVAALSESDESFLNETADLIYHLLVLLREKQIPLSQVAASLEKRHLKRETAKE